MRHRFRECTRMAAGALIFKPLPHRSDGSGTGCEAGPRKGTPRSRGSMAQREPLPSEAGVPWRWGEVARDRV